MKNFLFSSFWKISALAFAVLMIGGISSKTFAYTDAQYATLNPNTSACTITATDVIHLTTGDLEAGLVTLGHDKIYVVPAGTYTVTGDIQMANCSVLVSDADTAGNVILNFQGGKSITSNGEQNFSIRGFDSSHRLEIMGTTIGIWPKNSSGITLSHLVLSGLSTYGIVLENVDNSTLSGIEISNIGSRGIMLSDSSDNTMSDINISSTPDGIRLQSNSNNNTISNTKIYTTSHGILLEVVIGNIINSNTIISGAMVGIYADITSGTTISQTTIKNNSLYGMYLGGGSNNTITENIFTTNAEAIFGDNTKNNTFSNNHFNTNTNGVRFDAGCSGNMMSGDEFLSNTAKNIELNDAHYNNFTNIKTQGSLIGIKLTNAHYNIFTGSTVAGNTEGVQLNTSSHNTLYLTNNNNGIFLYGGSDNNSIYNKQSGNTGLNNVTIYNGSNNTITGGIFAATSTTSTSVNANLRNGGTTTVNYTLGGAGLSGAYTGTLGASSILSLPITLTAGVGTKDITVNYGNGNIFYDTITLSTTSGGGNGGGGGGGGSVSCVSSQLVCSGGVRTRVSGTSCTSSLIGNACTIGGGTGTLPVGSIVGSTYSTELNNAYLWAYANGITTMNTIQKANMGGYLIRSHMAKMISNFAITLGGFTPDTTKECTFDDIANQSAEMKFYIKLSCQLGLMGVGIDNFDPKGTITRAQFGTILSRLIRGNTYEGGIKYYTNHLNALKIAGIMTQISTPTMKELRGYVMLMMKRTYEGGFLNN